jgi:hypothetical protein
VTVVTIGQTCIATACQQKTSGKQGSNSVGRRAKKLQTILRDVSAGALSGYRASMRWEAKNPFAYRPAIRQILM